MSSSLGLFSNRFVGFLFILYQDLSPRELRRREEDDIAAYVRRIYDDDMNRLSDDEDDDDDEAITAPARASTFDTESMPDMPESGMAALTDELGIALCDHRIDQCYMTAMCPIFSIGLEEARSNMWSIVANRPWKVGITRGPLHRYAEASYCYANDGFTAMSLLLASSPSHCAALEKALIADFRAGRGPPQCLNIRSGGENAPKTAHCFTYVVVKDLVAKKR